MTNRICFKLALSIVLAALTINDGKTVAATIDFIQGDFEENLFVQGQFRGEDRNGNYRLELSELETFAVTLQSNQLTTVLYKADLADLSEFTFSYAGSDNNYEDSLQFKIDHSNFEIELDASPVVGNSTVTFGGDTYSLEGPLGLPIETDSQSPQGVPEKSGIVSIISLGAVGLSAGKPLSLRGKGKGEGEKGKL
ncbi:MAG: hypothetical protein ACFB4I_22180 [Cyanophyceae cyanobacterium]